MTLTIPGLHADSHDCTVEHSLPPGVQTAVDMLRQAGDVTRWAMKDPQGRIGAACWMLRDDVKLVYRDVPEVSLTYHVNGSTTVSRFEQGRCTAQGVRIGATTINPPGSCEWELRGGMEFIHLYLPQQTLHAYTDANPEYSHRGLSLEPTFAASDPWLNAFFAMLQAEADLGRLRGHDSLLLDSLLNHLLDHLFSRYGGRALPAQAHLPSRRAAHKLSAHLLTKIDAFLVEHLGQDISLARLAGLTGYSEGHFLRAFRNSKGVTPYQYLISMRIQQARQLLEASELPINELARSLGFVSAAYFSEQFKRRTGVTPAAYRRFCRRR